MLSWGSRAGCTSRDVFSSLILSSFFFLFFFFLFPFYPFEICLSDLALASSPGCQLRGLCPLFARRAAGREASCTCCPLPMPVFCLLGGCGSCLVSRAEFGEHRNSGKHPPMPHFSWLCLLAAPLLFSAVAAFELKMGFKKIKPQTSLYAEQWFQAFCRLRCVLGTFTWGYCCFTGASVFWARLGDSECPEV